MSLKFFPQENMNNTYPSSQGPNHKPRYKVHPGEPVSTLDSLTERWVRG